MFLGNAINLFFERFPSSDVMLGVYVVKIEVTLRTDHNSFSFIVAFLLLYFIIFPWTTPISGSLEKSSRLLTQPLAIILFRKE